MFPDKTSNLITTGMKTLGLMEFVCTLNSDANIEVVDKTKSRNLPFADQYLCFGDYGQLFVLFIPETKIVCLTQFCHL
ncbi:MAG TPA: hypothetical protein VIK78_10960 [Ruminiclostridium sp.]